MNEGEHWAYSTSDTGWYQEAVVKKIEDRSAVITFLDRDGVEGPRLRVPKKNLRCPSEDAYDYRLRARILEADRNAEIDAAEFVLRSVVGSDVAMIDSRHDATVYVCDLAALSSVTGFTEAQLESPNIDAYIIARAAAARMPDQLLQLLDDDERQSRYEALKHFDDYRASWYLSDKDRLEEVISEAGRLTTRRNWVLREWAGQEAVDSAAEIHRLRSDIVVTTQVAESALALALKTAKSNRARDRVFDLLRTLESVAGTSSL